MGFVLITLGYVAFRTFYIYKFVHITIALTLVALLFVVPLTERLANRVVILGLPMYILLLYIFINLITTEHSGFALLSAATSFSVAGLAFLVGMLWRQHYSIQEISGFFPVLACGYIALCFINLLQYGDMMAVAQGSFRTEIAAVTAMCMPMLYARAVKMKSKSAMVIGFALVALAIHGQSRITLVLLGLTAVIIAAINFRPRLLPHYLVALIVCTGLAGIAIPDELLTRFSESASLKADESVLHDLGKPLEMQVDVDRRLMTFVAKRELAEHPIFGIGYMQLLALISEEFGREVSAHGFAPGLLSELGLVGGIALAILLFSCFKALHHTYKNTTSDLERAFTIYISIAFGLLLIFGMFHQLLEYPLFSLLAGYALMGAKIPRRPVGFSRAAG